MLLVLARPDDPVAAWVAAGLSARGRDVTALASTDLAHVATWVHEVDATSARVRAQWADGRVLSSGDVAATYNRLAEDPTVPTGAAEGERAYAAEELRAFALSWLACLPGPMLNRVGPGGWSGDDRHPIETHVLASRAGLPVDAWFDDPPRWPGDRPVQRVLVVGDEVIGPPLARRWADGCRALAAGAGLGVAGVDFVPSAASPGSWVVDRLDPRPDLRRGGERALLALERALGGAS